MVAILSLMVVVVFSLLVTRTAAIALSLTGLSEETARFQARSAFSGVGFTTSEAESIVNHPVRRRICMTLMLVGNVGIVTAASAMILSFANTDGMSVGIARFLTLAGLLLALWFVTTRPWCERVITAVIERALKRWTSLDVRDYASLLRLTGDYTVAEIKIDTEDWMAAHTLGELRLNDEGVAVLGLQRSDGTYLGAPTDAAHIRPGDVAILYGRAPRIAKLDVRRRDAAGEACRIEGLAEHQETLRTQRESADSQQKM